jgi:uncharacterized protein YjdB
VKSLLRPFCCSVLLSLVTVSCSREIVDIYHMPVVTVDPEAVTIVAGERRQLSATAVGADVPGFTWKSLHPEFALVDDEGEVRGIAPGVASIIATSRAHPGAIGVARVTVQSTN